MKNIKNHILKLHTYLGVTLTGRHILRGQNLVIDRIAHRGVNAKGAGLATCPLLLGSSHPDDIHHRLVIYRASNGLAPDGVVMGRGTVKVHRASAHTNANGVLTTV